MLDELDDLGITQVKTLELVLVQNDLFCRHAYLDVDVEEENGDVSEYRQQIC
jgi:hypothetical protein